MLLVDTLLFILVEKERVPARWERANFFCGAGEKKRDFSLYLGVLGRIFIFGGAGENSPKKNLRNS